MPANVPAVILFGELLWDLLPEGRVLGGAPANCALRLQSLGFDVALLSRVGTDEPGQSAIKELEGRGLSCRYVQRDSNHPTGTAAVSLDANGSPAFVITPGVAYDFIQPEPSLFAYAKTVNLIVFGTLVQRSLITRATLQDMLNQMPNATRLLDINLRKDCYSAETIEASLRSCDILKLNDAEVLVLQQMLGLGKTSLPSFCRALFSRFELEKCLITRGSEGVYGMDRKGHEVEIPGCVVKVADTIGSGDAFTAGFACRYLEHADFEECCSFGNALGALAATKTGGMAPISRVELEAFRNALPRGS